MVQPIVIVSGACSDDGGDDDDDDDGTQRWLHGQWSRDSRDHKTTLRSVMYDVYVLRPARDRMSHRWRPAVCHARKSFKVWSVPEGQVKTTS